MKTNHGGGSKDSIRDLQGCLFWFRRIEGFTTGSLNQGFDLQIKNTAKALKVLCAKLYERERTRIHASRSKLRAEQIAKLAMIPEKKKLRKTRISPFNKKSGSLLGRMATMEEDESPTSAGIEASNQVVVTRARPQRANSRKATYVLSDDDSEDAATAAVDLDSDAAEYSISDVTDDDSDFN